MSFILHPDLKRDGIDMGVFSLCRVLLINDSAYPWFVLVPMRANLQDTIDMSAEDHAQLWIESREFSVAIMRAFQGDKLNVAALGNMTPQLHIHHIVRYEFDAAWPGPIWGKQALQPYTDAGAEQVRHVLNSAKISGFKAK
ncbi:MAG: HIT domain-containing protein [Alphaproteobacteria bacterium]